MPIFIYALIQMQRRQEFQPLKSRSVNMIFCQTLGNLIFFTFTTLNKINSNNIWPAWKQLSDPSQYSNSLKLMIWASCFMGEFTGWLAQPMIYIPYLLRAIRLKQIWAFAEEQVTRQIVQSKERDSLNLDVFYDTNSSCRLYCIKKRYFTKILAFIFVPLLILAVASGLPGVHHFLPNVSISQCFAPTANYYVAINSAMRNMLWVQFLHNIAFFVAIFMLRDIEDQFNIIDELRKVCIVTTVCTNAYITFIVYFDTSVFVVLGWCQYLLLAESLAILYLTALNPIARSFK